MFFRKYIVFIVGRLLRTIFRLIRDLDGLFSFLTGKLFKSKYEITGGCNKRGVCCQNIAIYLSDEFWKYEYLKKLAINWYVFVYNFEYKAEEPDLKVVVFKCNYLKDNQCSIYWKRPFICRNFPEVRFFDRPTFLPGCGYSYKLRKDKSKNQKNN